MLHKSFPGTWVNTMNKFEYEQEAARGDPMPAGLSLAEQSAYQAMRSLYALYKRGNISKEAAAKEKAAILGSFWKAKEQEDFMQRILEDNARMWKEIEAAGNRFGRERTVEAAEAFHKAVYGVGLKGVL